VIGHQPLELLAGVLAAANYECACCTSRVTEVHHRDYRPNVLSGNNIIPLVAVCRPCHTKIERTKAKESWNEAEIVLASMVAAKETQIAVLADPEGSDHKD
jgi:hypothetical protein